MQYNHGGYVSKDIDLEFIGRKETILPLNQIEKLKMATNSINKCFKCNGIIKKNHVSTDKPPSRIICDTCLETKEKGK